MCFSAGLFGGAFALYVLEFGRKSASEKLQRLYRARTRPFDEKDCHVIIKSDQRSFCNWAVVTINHMTRAHARHFMFSWTVVAHHRGLSRSGRDFLASKDLLLKHTLYQQMLNEKSQVISDELE